MAPYELKDSDLKSVLSKHGRIKGGVIRHHHKGYDIQNENRSVLYYEKPSNIPTTLWVQGNKVKVRYNGQDRTAICSYCKSKGHFRGICPKEKEDIEWKKRMLEEQNQEKENLRQEEERYRTALESWVGPKDTEQHGAKPE